MKCFFKKKPLRDTGRCTGFTLAEAVAAIVILGLICTSTLVVINSIMLAAADETLKMQAFQVARENIEKLLASGPVKESTEYGTSEQYPQITWQTTVESFYEPLTTRMWIQAVCTAEYFDSAGEQQTVELTNWLTDVSKQQILDMLKNKEQNTKLLIEADQILQTIQEAAAFTGVDQGTIQQWVNNGMPITEEGYFIKAYLDLYNRTNGNPTVEDRMQVEEYLKELTQPVEDMTEGEDKSSMGDPKGPAKSNNPTKTEKPSDSDLISPDDMSFDELWKYLQDHPELSL